MDDSRDRLSFLGRRPGSAFERRLVAVDPGRSLAYHEAEWKDALVVVERGEIELEWSAGGRQRFGRGDVLWLAGLPLRSLHNRGREPALLAAISRRRSEAGDEFLTCSPSYQVSASLGCDPTKKGRSKGCDR